MGCSTSAVSGHTPPAAQSGAQSFHDQYELLGKLGKGSFAKVYLANETETNTQVAVKVTALTQEGDAEETARAQRRSQQEVATLRRVAHLDAVVRIRGSFMDDQFSYIVMEKCDCTLPRYLDMMQDVSEATLAPLFRSMLQALACVHAAGVVHRDVKPDNWLCTGAPRGPAGPGLVKLVDFGLATVMTSPTAANLRGRHGTLPFFSPELLRDEGYGAKTDVWSLGVMAYVMMLGSLPCRGCHEVSARSIKAAIATGSPAPSFKVCASRAGVQDVSLSSQGTSFLKALLTREVAHRPTASKAACHPWFAEAAAEPDAGTRRQLRYPCLRGVWNEARRTGAFETRHIDVLEARDKYDMDTPLAAMQRQRLGRDCRMMARANTKVAVCEKAGSLSNDSLSTATSDIAFERTSMDTLQSTARHPLRSPSMPSTPTTPTTPCTPLTPVSPWKMRPETGAILGPSHQGNEQRGGVQPAAVNAADSEATEDDTAAFTVASSTLV